MYTVYQHVNRATGKVYVGSTGINPVKRWKRGKGYIQLSEFYNDIQQLGWDGFSHEILEHDLTKDAAETMENELICKYLAECKELYNSKRGSAGHHKCSEYSRNRISESNKGKHTMSDEHREIMSSSKKAYWEAHPEKRRQPKVPKDIRVSIDVYWKDGTFVKGFDSLRDAARELGLTYSHISECYQGKRKSTNGFVVVPRGEEFRPFTDGRHNNKNGGRPKKTVDTES